MKSEVPWRLINAANAGSLLENIKQINIYIGETIIFKHDKHTYIFMRHATTGIKLMLLRYKI